MATHILVECPALIASVRVGVLGPLSQLEREGKCQTRFQRTRDITRKDIAWCDILVCVRGCEYPTAEIVRNAKAAGRMVVYFLDDDLLNIPVGNESTQYYLDYKIKENLINILSQSDVLWAVNTRIIEKYGASVKRSVLSRVPAIPKAVASPNCSQPVHILYAGSVDHSELVQTVLAPAVARLCKEHAGEVDFTFIGADPKLKGMPGVVQYPFFNSYERYQQVVIEGCFSVGLAPVLDTEFYRCKYYNKFIEYTTMGAVGIYSNLEPYTQVVKHGENGFLCGNTSEDWYRAILEVLTKRAVADKCARQAVELLKREFTYGQVGAQLESDLPELTTFPAPQVEEKTIGLRNMRLLFYEERFLLLWRNYGLLVIFIAGYRALRKIVRKLLRKED